MEFTKKQFEEHVGLKLNFQKKENGLILATTYDSPDLWEDLEGKAKKPYEPFQIFDHNDQPIVITGSDAILYRKECHGPDRIMNVYHRGANGLIIKNDHYLLPIRAPNKDLFASMGDISVSEHVNVREGYFDSMIRGFSEEQGTKPDLKYLKLFMKIPVIDDDQSEMCEYYIYYDQGENYKISEETESQKWINLNDLVGKDIGKELNFRPDHLPALKMFFNKFYGNN